MEFSYESSDVPQVIVSPGKQVFGLYVNGTHISDFEETVASALELFMQVSSLLISLSDRLPREIITKSVVMETAGKCLFSAWKENEYPAIVSNDTVVCVNCFLKSASFPYEHAAYGLYVCSSCGKEMVVS